MLKATVKYLAQETSIHGFKFLANKKVNKFLRLFWFFSLLLSISVLLWYAKGLYVKLNFEPEINVRVKFKSMSEIPFPAVTICDSVFAKNNSINFIQYFNNKRLNSQKNMTVEGKHIMAANIHVCAPHLSFFNQDFDDKRSDFDIVKVLNDSSLRTDEIFLLCSYKKTLAADCNNIFNKVLTDNGFCHSANMQGYNTIFNKNVLSKDFDSYKRKNISSSWLHKTRQVNDDNETIYWTLDSGYIDDSDDSNVIPKRANKQNFFNNYLFINHIDKENYCPQLGKIFKIFFHLPNEMPTIFNREYSIEIGHQKLMFLNAKLYTSDESLKGYTPKQRQCYFEGEKNLKFFKSYTKSHCDWECVTNYTLDICGCTKFSMPRDNNTPVCDMQKKKCYYNAMLTWPNNRSFYENNDNPCDCYETCNDIKYEINYEDDSDFHNFYSLSLLKNAQE
ncbi:hypothetical protein PVAND_017708 [Polypedilum vanderplanki]|uniref:Uncharacterized protein n=1 Tax=Polypedilum vanderplanki TaxID=319348 RepID=A0A9J6B8X9_POLVA|nr:hypothetical protein PVAND_017708 [Polypedilum vanderplanki]